MFVCLFLTKLTLLLDYDLMGDTCNHLMRFVIVTLFLQYFIYRRRSFDSKLLDFASLMNIRPVKVSSLLDDFEDL